MVHRLSSYILALVSLQGGCMSAGTTSPPGGSPFVLTAPGRADNELLPGRFGGRNAQNPNCAGENVSPALAWNNAPAGTRSFVLLMDDQAGRAGLGVNHWTAYGIPAAVTALPEGAGDAARGFIAGKNTIGMSYLGPCPPRGNAPQHYVFTLIATTLEPDALPAGLTKSQLLEMLRGKTLGAASLVQRFAH